MIPQKRCPLVYQVGKMQFALYFDKPTDPSLDWKIHFRCHSAPSSVLHVRLLSGSRLSPRLHPLTSALNRSSSTLECRYPRPLVIEIFCRPLIDPPQSPSTTLDSARSDESVPGDAPLLDAVFSAAAAALIPLPDRAVLPGISPPSSPRGSAARESCDTRTAPALARSHECAYVTPSE